MNKQDIAHIIHEIRSIPYYNIRIREIEDTLIRLSDELLEIGGTHCPLSNTEPHVSSGKPQSSRLLEVMTEEAKYEELKKHYQMCLCIAEELNRKVYDACGEAWERNFLTDFLSGVSYEKLKHEHGITNVYLTVCRIVRRIDF